MRAPKGGGPNLKKVGPRRVGPAGWGPEGWGAQNFALFPLPPQFAFFLLSLGGPFVEFWGCLKCPGPGMCTFGVLGLPCEAPAALKNPGFHTTTREPKRGHVRAPAFTKTTKIQREDNSERVKERNFGRSGGGGGGPTEGGPLEGGPAEGGATPPTRTTTTTTNNNKHHEPQQQHTTTTQTNEKQTTQNNTNTHTNTNHNTTHENGLANDGLAKIGQTTDH